MNAIRRASVGTMFHVLLHMQFARLRRSWRPYIVFSVVMPAGIVLLLHITSLERNASTLFPGPCCYRSLSPPLSCCRNTWPGSKSAARWITIAFSPSR